MTQEEAVKSELEIMRWYLDSAECPEEHKPQIRNAIGQMMDYLAQNS